MAAAGADEVAYEEKGPFCDANGKGLPPHYDSNGKPTPGFLKWGKRVKTMMMVDYLRGTTDYKEEIMAQPVEVRALAMGLLRQEQLRGEQQKIADLGKLVEGFLKE